MTHNAPGQFNTHLQNYINQHLAEVPQSTSPRHLKIDLHCHDHNSNVTNELWGRLLNLPETWLTTEDLVMKLKYHQTDCITITNHNNARSCWNLCDKGYDVLAGAEFTCTFPDMNLQVHVLTYGFTPEQEARLNRLRKNIYAFRDYTREHQIATVLAHPLYFYTTDPGLSIRFLDKLALMFECFEGCNGQRNAWQNALTLAWINSLTPDRLDDLGRQTGIPPDRYCKHPYRKQITGGSDDHGGLFAGSCGTLFDTPRFVTNDAPPRASTLIHQALLEGSMKPYGLFAEGTKLNIALMDYFFQVSQNMQDPGLLRLMFHKGGTRDKLTCYVLANALLELKRHKHTMKFIHIFRNILQGKKNSYFQNFILPVKIKRIARRIHQMTLNGTYGQINFVHTVNQTIEDSFDHFLKSITGYINHRYASKMNHTPKHPSAADIPVHFRHTFMESEDNNHTLRTIFKRIALPALLDKLSFPILGSLILLFATKAGTGEHYKHRRILNTLADELDMHPHPKSMLWIFGHIDDPEKQVSLQEALHFVKSQNLPVYILIFGEDAKGLARDEPRLIAFQEGHTLNTPYPQIGNLFLPNLITLETLCTQHHIDRILTFENDTSPLIALWLGTSFNIPIYLLSQYNWPEIFTRSGDEITSRLRRILRTVYQNFSLILYRDETLHTRMNQDIFGFRKDTLTLLPDRSFTTPKNLTTIFSLTGLDSHTQHLNPAHPRPEKAPFSLWEELLDLSNVS